MSKSLATKWVHPWVKCPNWAKSVIFCVATIIFQHCLNPLGHGVHQSFTGCHWSPLPLLHDDITGWWMLETLRSSTFRLRITFTLSFFSKAVVILEVVFGGRYVGNTALRPVSEGRGSCSASVCHSTCCHSWFPQMNCRLPSADSTHAAPDHDTPTTMLDVGKTHLSLYSSSGCRHTRLTPSEPKKFILVSSDYRTWFQ